MNSRLYASAILSLSSFLLACCNAQPSAAEARRKSSSESRKGPESLHELKARRIDGKAEPLSNYRGKVLLVVNTASECGYTYQYAGLEKLHQKYKDRGFAVLAFPSNDFGGQEPGSAKDIAKFCSSTFKVSFPVFDKVKTKGPGQSPVYAFLTRDHEAPKWNFFKYLVDKRGRVLKVYPSVVEPESVEIQQSLERELKARSSTKS